MYSPSTISSTIRDIAQMMQDTIDQFHTQFSMQIKQLPDLADLIDEDAAEQTTDTESPAAAPAQTETPPVSDNPSPRGTQAQSVSAPTLSETTALPTPVRPANLSSEDPRQDDLLDRLWQKMVADHLEDALLIQAVVAERGYYPAETPITAYDPDFISGCLLDAWPKVRQLAKEKQNDVPF